MELAGRICCIRPIRRGDAAALARQANNPNVARHLRDGFPHPYSLADARAYIQSISPSGPVTQFAISVEDEFVGGIGFAAGKDVERFSAEVGYWIGEPFWRRGIATEALQLVAHHAFTQHRVLRLYALPFADNAASIRVLEKAGFSREGTLRASAVKAGIIRDQALYASVNTRFQI